MSAYLARLRSPPSATTSRRSTAVAAAHGGPRVPSGQAVGPPGQRRRSSPAGLPVGDAMNSKRTFSPSSSASLSTNSPGRHPSSSTVINLSSKGQAAVPCPDPTHQLSFWRPASRRPRQHSMQEHRWHFANEGFWTQRAIPSGPTENGVDGVDQCERHQPGVAGPKCP